MTLGAWLWQARARRNARRLLRPLGPPEPLVDELAPERSFIDVGAIWRMHGKVAFRAEGAGATRVTALDVAPPTAEYRDEHESRGSKVRFVLGDLHEPATREEAGAHDVVWCSGVVYHCPNPLHTLECLRELTLRTLVLISATLPEAPGARQAAVFFPGLEERQRRAYDAAYSAALGPGEGRLGLTSPFDPEQRYGNWWWGLTPSSLRGMLEVAGFSVVQTKSNGFHTRVVARAV